LCEGNGPSQSKEGYFGPLRRRYEPIRENVHNTLASSGINPQESSFRRAKKAFSRKIFKTEAEGDTDPKTGIPNIRGLNKILANELPLASRLGVTSVDIEVDLDGLKKINDTTKSHLEGDKMINNFVDVVKASIRGSDAFARVGGDEFRIVLFGTDLVNAETKWDEIRTKLAEVQVSASAGAALINYDDFTESIKKADIAMYNAKQTFKQTGTAKLGVAL
jgi:diguanylate cyclase (GGDEF)-like protein